MTTTTHGACGKTIPTGSRAGHCGACHENFIGLTAFDAHRTGPYDNRTCQIQPYETVGDNGKTKYGHWADNNGNWHHGRQLTADERTALFDRKADK